MQTVLFHCRVINLKLVHHLYRACAIRGCCLVNASTLQSAVVCAKSRLMVKSRQEVQFVTLPHST